MALRENTVMPAPASASAVALRGVSKSYGNRLVVSNVSLEVAQGEFLAILGPSGSGKTTIIRIIGGFEVPDAGSVLIAGEDVTLVPAERRNVNTVFQSYALFPHLNVLDNVAYGPRMRDVPRSARYARAHQLLDLVRLSAAGDRKPYELSGGMQQRVALARALANDPAVLLLDEPLGALDRKLRDELQRELRRVQTELAATFIYVTHDQEEAFGMADRLVVLREGVVQQVGTPDDVYAHPANRYVAGFMGYRNMLEFDLESATAETAVLASKDVRLSGMTFGPIEAKRAVAAIRPEDILVNGPGPNRLQVTAEVVEYHGREILVLARLPAGEALYIRTEERCVAGDSIVVAVPPERVLIYPADAPAAPTEAIV